MRGINIAGRNIGTGYPPFIVAEMSGNHNQSLKKALEMVEAASQCGAHAIKLQTFTADTMTIDCSRTDFYINDENSLWKGISLYDLYRQASTPWEWHEPIFNKCRELGIIAFSTPFDESAVDFLELFKVPCYKVASFENTDLPLISKIASTGKPMIISTGMATVAELDETITIARQAGCKDIILLKCTSTYPASPDDTNLLTIPHMRELFNCLVGLSDHTLGIGASIASIALGSVMIEKHFTLNRTEGGVDADFSLEPVEMHRLVDESDRAWRALGKVMYGPTHREMDSKQFRRSIYAVEDIRKGALFSNHNIRIIRPGYGLAPKYYHIVLGKKAKRNIKRGTPLNWDLL